MDAMALTSQALLAELDARLPRTSPSRRGAVLRQIVDLFVGDAPLYSGEQVELFDEVFGRLIEGTEKAPLAEMSSRLAPIENAPVKSIGRLARHKDPAVRSPILDKIMALAEAVVIEIADRDNVDPELLMKITRRPQLSAAVTDVLVKRGGKPVQRAVIDNPNAVLSEAGFARVIMGINGDKELAAAIARRKDVPPELRIWLDKALSG
jgi:uncharacterized protein (DUF2336 family)